MNRIRKAGDGPDGRTGGGGEVAGAEAQPPGGTRLRVVGGRAETPDIPPPIRAVIDPHAYRVEVLFSALTDEQWRMLPRGGVRLDYVYHEPTKLYVRLEERRIPD